jgi:hypothetical protein
VKPTRRFAFGHDHVPPRAARQPPQHGDEITAPLPDCTAPVAPACDARSTVPFVDFAAVGAPTLPFCAPLTPAPREIAPCAPPAVAAVAPPPVAAVAPPTVVTPVAPPPVVAPVVGPRTRRGVYVAIAIVSLALYNGALLVFVVPRRALEAAPAASVTAPMLAPTSSAATAPEASTSAPVPSVTASAHAPPANAPPPLATPRPAPQRVPRPPAPARTLKPTSEVLNPWGYD